MPYSRREATLFQGVRFFYNLILKSVILNDIVALFLCKPRAIGSKAAKLLATLDFEMLPEFWCCITCFQVYVEFFLNLVNFFGIFSEISPEIAIMLLQKSPYFGIIYLDLVTMSKTLVIFALKMIFYFYLLYDLERKINDRSPSQVQYDFSLKSI